MSSDQTKLPILEVTYTTTVDDFVALSLHAAKRSPFLKCILALGWVVLPAEWWIRAALQDGSGEAFRLVVAGLVYAALYPIIVRVVIGVTVRIYALGAGTRGVIGRITLILDDETLTEQTESVRSIIRWRDMKRVDVVGDRTYIFVTGLTVAIVPRHGFERPEDYEAVKEFALAKVAKP